MGGYLDPLRDPAAESPRDDDVAYVEQTRKIPNRLIGDEEGFVTIIERWEPARPGEYAPLVVWNPVTKKSTPMKMVSRTRKP